MSTVVTGESRSFYLSRQLLVVGIGSLVLWPLMMMAFFLGAGPNRKIDQSWIGISMILFFVFMLVGSVWMTVAYFRQSLVLNDSTIIQRGVFRSKTIRIDDVSGIKWCIRPARGSIVVSTASEKITIELYPFGRQARNEMVHFFRGAFAENIQKDWPQFHKCLPYPIVWDAEGAQYLVRLTYWLCVVGALLIFGVLTSLKMSNLAPPDLTWWKVVLTSCGVFYFHLLFRFNAWLGRQ